ncbi:Uncharacterized protein Adt_30276 [Abeliophyllum distichum]|uniref:Retrotransposon gag domain-containing protein n=1 Tax=Abeliophyllum distichum TaxID=126358 RepID=A0ABD1RAT1_9LAMI
MEIHDMRELEWPQRMAAPPSKRDKRKYCYFHRDHGHDTESCFQLKEELERLLKRGFLAKCVKHNRGKEIAMESPTNTPPRAGVMNVISGGAAEGGNSNSAIKSYACSSGVGSNQKKTGFSQDITFGEKDLIG